jgi:hypothetical protein
VGKLRLEDWWKTPLLGEPFVILERAINVVKFLSTHALHCTSFRHIDGRVNV